MIKIYVDKYPDNCLECPCYRSSQYGLCYFDNTEHIYIRCKIYENCPLKLISEYKK